MHIFLQVPKIVLSGVPLYFDHEKKIKNKKDSSERIFFQFMDFFLDISEAAAYLQADNGT